MNEDPWEDFQSKHRIPIEVLDPASPKIRLLNAATAEMATRTQDDSLEGCTARLEAIDAILEQCQEEDWLGLRKIERVQNRR